MCGGELLIYAAASVGREHLRDLLVGQVSGGTAGAETSNGMRGGAVWNTVDPARSICWSL